MARSRRGVPHINTQLFGILDEGNRGVLQPEKTFNTPDYPNRQPTMDGFLTDYISMYSAEFNRQPTHDEYAQFMTGYTPRQMPVTSGIARGFATFDHWFCDVPSCTFPNRSFFHAATSSGYVVNMTPPESFIAHNTAETLFERLEAHGLTWKVYCDPPSHYSLTGLIHAPGCARSSRRTSSRPTSSSRTPSEANCRPTPSSNRRSSAMPTTTCIPRTACSPPASPGIHHRR
ncbi:alkaline phosphatase family protein [Streptomyces sp. NBC_00162]|uniref:alkaline phosphatase family protein n=1 Tax=Streptomyces sp. NBC_00162 TaxID=2903629 RepID=UPI00214C405C|nr:alkaline phosphatase family protein [Streptomyces sp. NBC_00162]UUU38804.1 hypothetical protein JIW86_08300 [Streptomyces sp. NBC_00162]